MGPHGGGAVRALALQQEGHRFKSGGNWCVCMEIAFWIWLPHKVHRLVNMMVMTVAPAPL